MPLFLVTSVMTEGVDSAIEILGVFHSSID